MKEKRSHLPTRQKRSTGERPTPTTIHAGTTTTHIEVKSIPAVVPQEWRYNKFRGGIVICFVSFDIDRTVALSPKASSRRGRRIHETGPQLRSLRRRRRGGRERGRGRRRRRRRRRRRKGQASLGYSPTLKYSKGLGRTVYKIHQRSKRDKEILDSAVK